LAIVGGLPAHTSVDGASAWNGVEIMLKTIFPDTRVVTPVRIDDEVRNRAYLLFEVII